MSMGSKASMLIFLALVALAVGVWYSRGSGSGSAQASCPRATPADRMTATQTVNRQTLQERATAFMTHCELRHSSDKRVRNLMRVWNRSVEQSNFAGDPATVWGTFNKATGCLMLRMDGAKSMEEQLAILLHELAHTSGESHDDTWKDCYLFFLGIATQEMGWRVTLKCPTACRSHAICAQSNCPACQWYPTFEACIS
jgi:predicted metal-dependent hydrolase